MDSKNGWDSRKESTDNRDAWGAHVGPWMNEPDRVEWRTATGHVGLIVRQMHSGHLCGYVGVEPGHPWHGKADGDAYALDVSVHGGVTYGAECTGRVCHVPAPGEPEHLWWIGFDAAHDMDVRPFDSFGASLGIFRMGDGAGEYRTIHYMRGEVERLAKQAAEATS